MTPHQRQAEIRAQISGSYINAPQPIVKSETETTIEKSVDEGKNGDDNFGKEEGGSEEKKEDEQIKKSGEGSRGGKVIGHTKSGKPIYDHFGHAAHENFTADDHSDAADIHRGLMDSSNKVGNGSKYHYHMGNRDAHKNSASKESDSENSTYKDHMEKYSKMGEGNKRKYRNQVKTTHDVGMGMAGEKDEEAKKRFEGHKKFLDDTKGK